MLRVKLIAIVAVRVARIFAFTPCPMPSERTAITLSFFYIPIKKYITTNPFTIVVPLLTVYLLKKFLFT